MNMTGRILSLQSSTSASVGIDDILSLFNISYRTLSVEEQRLLLNAVESGMYTQFVDGKVPVEKIIVFYIARYLPPAILLLGIFGNVTSLIVLLQRTMVKQTTNIFLAVLALSDCIVLLVGLLRSWLGLVADLDIQNKTNWLCKLATLLTYGSSHFSAWIIVSFTVFRYIAVSTPHKVSKFCSLTTCKRVIAMLAGVALVLNLHFVWTVELKENVDLVKNGFSCEPKSGFNDVLYNIWPWVDASVFALVPFSTLAILNTLIIFHMRRAVSWRRHTQRRNSNGTGHLVQANTKVTVTLLTVSFSFLITTLPMATVMVLQNYWKNDSTLTTERLAQRQLIRTIAEMLMYVNSSMNFFLYCAIGKKFREQMFKTFCGKRCGNPSTDHSKHMYCVNYKSSKRTDSTSSTWL